MGSYKKGDFENLSSSEDNVSSDEEKEKNVSVCRLSETKTVYLFEMHPEVLGHERDEKPQLEYRITQCPDVENLETRSFGQQKNREETSVIRKIHIISSCFVTEHSVPTAVISG